MTRNVVSLFDESTNMVRPWAAAGWHCYCLDILNPVGGMAERTAAGGSITRLHWDALAGAAAATVAALTPHILFSFAPCTDLAVSGARHFAAKAAANPDYRRVAVSLARFGPDLGERLGVPYMLENPVGVLSTQWRKPDHVFHPWEYGGYLPADDMHPRWPQYIAPQDAYPKRTCLWTGQGFAMPEVRPVPVRAGWSDQQLKLGGKSAKTKQIRSETPRGFAQAVFQSNAHVLRGHAA